MENKMHRKITFTICVLLCINLQAQTWSASQMIQKSKATVVVLKKCEPDLIWQRASTKDKCIADLTKLLVEFEGHFDAGSKTDECWTALTQTVGGVGWSRWSREKPSDIAPNLHGFAIYRDSLAQCERALKP
jgi:hypothetical protein